MNAERKVKCDELRCPWIGTEEQSLKAPNPFDAGDEVIGCPHCKSIGTIIYVCDEPGCWKDSTCGTPTLEGYRSTCGEHRPIKIEVKI